jgi:tetratricopeptide (TPR) repeat protein
MNWPCPECGGMNEDSISRCMCGYELDTPVPTYSDQADGTNSLLPGYSDTDVLLQITNPAKKKNDVLKKIAILIVSLGIFAGTGLFQFTLKELMIVIIVLFIHEAGHLTAMKLFKYSDVKMFFLPLIGAAVAGREPTPYSSRKAMVSIAGPLPGLFIGLCFVLLHAWMKERIYYDIASMFILINAFNLLPLYPLDGGRFFDLILFSRNYSIEVIFKVGTSLLFIMLAISLQTWVLILIPLFIILSLKSSYYVYKATKGLKAELFHAGIETLKLDEQIVGRIRSGLDEKALSGKRNLKNLATLVDATWQRLFNIPPSPLKTVSLLFLYFVCVCFAGAAIVGIAASIDRGSVYLIKGEHDRAISELNKVIEINPKDSGAYKNRGAAYLNKGQFDLAISDYTKALEINPKDAEVYNIRGRAYYFKGKYEESWEDLNKAEDLGYRVPPEFFDDLRNALGRQK